MPGGNAPQSLDLFLNYKPKKPNEIPIKVVLELLYDLYPQL